MKGYAVIGLGAFGRQVAEELSRLGVELIIADPDRERIERCQQLSSQAYVMSVLSQEIVRRIIPASLEAAIIDLGRPVETSILLTSYLKKMGIRRIIVKGESQEHAEILSVVGASHVILPDREAARKAVPLLVSASLASFLPLSRGIVVAEVRVPPPLVGRTMLEADVRRRYGITIVAVKGEQDEEYDLASTEERFRPGDLLLVTGRDEPVAAFAGLQFSVKRKKNLRSLLVRLRN